MDIDYSRLFPAVFNDKDIMGMDWVNTFFTEFNGDAASNSAYNTFVGFLHGEYEVRVHFVVNRLTVEFTCSKPPKELVDKIIKFFSIDPQDETSPIISVSWMDGVTTINFQYYHKPFEL